MRPTLLALLVLACPLLIGATAAPARAQPAPGSVDFDPSNPPTTTRVAPGETLYSIAERTRSPVQGLIAVNRLSPPYALSPGQILTLPPLKVHVARRGESFAEIAGRYSIDPRSLAVFNRLPRPVQVRAGQRIILPPMVRDRFSGLEPQDLVDLLAGEVATGRRVPRGAVGARGAGARPSVASVEPAPPVTPPVAPPVTLPETPPQKSPPPPPSPPPKAAPPTKAGPSPPAAAERLFAWPMPGPVVETFGDKPGFRRNDGIDIAGDADAPFKAAGDGEVVYVGNEIPGYGWLVLVRHSGDWMTTYARANRVRVREGDRVRQGQTLGEIGAIGAAQRPRLHFQVRRATRPVDPLRHLPVLR